MTEPIRILHVFGKTNLGGAESRTMDLYRHIDRDRVQFDFLVHTDENCFFDEEIQKLGGQIYRVPRFKLYNIFSYRKAIKAFLKKHHEFKAVQGHMTSTASIYLPIAKKAGIPITIAHARSAGVDQGIKGSVTRLLRWNLWKKADYLFTCSEIAAISVYGEKAANELAIFIPNAIDAEKFAFNEEIRRNLRNELSIEDKFVIGHVGRFHYAKNHEYMIDVFQSLSETRINGQEPVLLLVGEGDGMQDIKDQVKKLNLQEKVLFLGNHADIWNYYQVFDYFVFPSRFEGLPGTVVEAQASGLRTVMSDTLTKEAVFSDLVHALPITAKPHVWADYIIQTSLYNRENTCQLVKDSGFDVNAQAQKMIEFYETGNKEVL